MLHNGRLSNSLGYIAPAIIMKPIKTKAQLRAEINAQIGEFLSQGGAVDQRPRGESGRHSNIPLKKPPHFEPNTQERTPVLSEIQAIEARRNKPKMEKKVQRRVAAEKKALLVDDFGEPLRWIPS